MLFRQIAQDGQKISASSNECLVLADIYKKSAVIYQKDLKSLIQKV